MFAQLDIRDSRTFTELQDIGDGIREFGDSVDRPDGVEVVYGGDLFAEFELPESEIYGLIAAVIILILAFGSVLAMGLPIGTALFGLGVVSALVSLLSNLISMPDFTTAMVAMIGIGVGIDYALFIVTRYRDNLHGGAPVETAIVDSLDTSGRAVLFAGLTVIISLLGLMLIGLSFVQGVAVASAVGVATVMAGSLTLLPALLRLVGARIDNTTWAALVAVGLVVVAAIVGLTTGTSGIFLGGVLLAVLFFAASFAVRPLAPTRRRVAGNRLGRSRSGTGGAGSSSAGHGRRRSARSSCSSCSLSRCCRSGSVSATTATTPRTRPCVRPTTCLPRVSDLVRTVRCS